MSEEEVIQFVSACWNKFGEHTATLVSAEQADIELFLARLKDDLDELRGNNKTLQAAIADREAEIEAQEEIIKAVAHIGVDFGFGVYALEQKHIDAARKLLEQRTKHDH